MDALYQIAGRLDILNAVPTEKELLDRIRDLEEQNSQLQDKLDQIWSVLASDYDDLDDDNGLVQIKQ